MSSGMSRLRLLVEAETRLWRRVEQELRQAGLPRLAWLEALSVITGRDDVRLNDVAVELAITPGGATKLVDAVERGGMVTRHPHPTDRRVTILAATASGRDALARGRTVVDDCVDALWPQHDLVAPLRQLTENLRAAEAGAMLPAEETAAR